MKTQTILLITLFTLLQGCMPILESKNDSTNSEATSVKQKGIAGKWKSTYVPQIDNTIVGNNQPFPTRIEFTDSSYKKYSGFFFLLCGNCARPGIEAIWYNAFETGKITLKDDSIKFSDIYKNWSVEGNPEDLELVREQNYSIGFALSTTKDSLLNSSSFVWESGAEGLNKDTLYVRDGN